MAPNREISDRMLSLKLLTEQFNASLGRYEPWDGFEGFAGLTLARAAPTTSTYTTIATITAGQTAFITNLFMIMVGAGQDPQLVSFREAGATSVFEWVMAHNAPVHLQCGGKPILEIAAGTFQVSQAIASGSTLYVIILYYEKDVTP